MGKMKEVCVLATVALLSCALLAAQAHEPRQITVAAAADLSTALKEVASAYENKSGVEVKLSFGASGALTQQIENGAPFDVFFSADTDYPRRLIREGHADAASLYRYAIGRLVLWVPTDSHLDPEREGIKLLLEPSVQKISIANPAQAPYGRAAVATLQHYEIYDKVSNKLVMGENISQAAQFVESGNAQAGFVALAHAVAPEIKGKGKYWVVPADAYPRLDQSVVVTSRSTHVDEARRFLEFVRSADAVAILARYGFEPRAGK